MAAAAGKQQGQLIADAVKALSSCAEVYRRVAAACSSLTSQQFMVVLSSGLDRMKNVKDGGSPAANLEAATSLLQLAVDHGLHTVNAWTLAAFIRCAAAFKGSLQPAGLEAWQAALKQPSRMRELNEQGAASALRSLGTLAESDPRLASSVDEELASELRRLAGQLTANAVKRLGSCAEMYRRVAAARSSLTPQQFMFVLSSALDRMRDVKDGGSPAANMQAASSLLQLAVEHGLHTVNAWTLSAFIRCAADFKGSLQPAGLEAWQAALKQPSRMRELNEQGAASALLSLGALAESDPRLASSVDEELASELRRLAGQLTADAFKQLGSCSEVYRWVAAARSSLTPQRFMYVLSSGLDRMKDVKDGSSPAANLEAATSLLQLAVDHGLHTVNTWTLVAFIRCAATFKGSLQPAGLEAWQRALQQPSRMQELKPWSAVIALASLGLLVESEPQLASCIDEALASELRRLAGQLTTDAVKLLDSCTDVYRRVAAACSSLTPQRFMVVLSAALDRMRDVKDGSSPAANLEAATSLLQLAVEHGLGAVDAWTLSAFVRCAAAFKGSLQPAGLEAWQAALKQPSRMREFEQDPHNVTSALLSLGTLAESDRRLARCIDKALASELLLQAVGSAGSTHQRAARHSVNALYGATLLGLRPTQAQMQALCSPVRRQPASLSTIDATQLLLACQKLMVLGSDAPAAPMPSEDPYLIYYPGNELIASLLGHLCQPERKLPLRDACQIVGACGALGFMPDAWVWHRLMAAVQTGVEAAGPLPGIEAGALLMGCARLGISPGFEIIAACWDAVRKEGPANPRLTANAAWALAVLEACDAQMWSKLAAMMRRHTSPQDIELHMWHQAYLLVEQRHAEEEIAYTRGDVDFEQRLSLALERCQRRAGGIGHFKATVKSAVERLAMGQHMVSGFLVCSPCGRGQVAVDVALPELRIAIEADGMRHFLRNGSPGQQTGDTLARNRLLRGWGWHVIVVPVTAWGSQFCVGTRPFQEQLVDRVQSYLQEHTDLVARLEGMAVPGSGR